MHRQLVTLLSIVIEKLQFCEMALLIKVVFRSFLMREIYSFFFRSKVLYHRNAIVVRFYSILSKITALWSDASRSSFSVFSQRWE
mmetsp:Transcript_19625/g.25421  ORF Transcript_19625/g.25421 Transcript_19625/m.25421 type:complete len:85 (-) Transcript_19625:89-343(-)